MKKTILTALVLLSLLSCGERDRFIQISGDAQGGVYTVKLNLKGVSVPPEEVRDSVEAILARIDTTLSGYNKGSLLSRFNAGETILPNALFLEMYRIAYGWYERSGGVLDFAARSFSASSSPTAMHQVARASASAAPSVLTTVALRRLCWTG